MTYTDQIKSPKWQKKRLEILEKHDFQCDDCQDTETQLHVHHIIYTKGKKAWEYPDDNFKCLCSECHDDTHFLQQFFTQIISKLDKAHRMFAVGFAQGVMEYTCGETIKTDGMPEPAFNGRYLAMEILSLRERQDKETDKG